VTHRVSAPVLAIVALAPASGVAQRGSEARLSLTITGGTTIGQPTLWSISRQPLLVPGTEADPQPLFDTVSIARGFVTNLIFGVSGTYFPKPSFGLEIGATWLGLTTETSCAGIAFDSLLGGTNRDMCTAMQGASRSLGAIEFSAGALARAASRGSISPYVRAALGITFYSVSTTYVEGPTSAGIRIVVDDPSRRRLALGYVLAAGTTIALGPGYQFRADVANVAERFERLTGPADRLAHAPRGHRFSHHLVFAMGLGIVLEAKRGRRY
jgi:hypothetical protein